MVDPEPNQALSDRALSPSETESLSIVPAPSAQDTPVALHRSRGADGPLFGLPAKVLGQDVVVFASD